MWDVDNTIEKWWNEAEVDGNKKDSATDVKVYGIPKWCQPNF